MSYVQVEARAAQARVPQEQWDAAQVDAGFEQMRREAVPLMSLVTLDMRILCAAPRHRHPRYWVTHVGATHRIGLC
jgi:hypothetical protein